MPNVIERHWAKADAIEIDGVQGAIRKATTFARRPPRGGPEQKWREIETVTHSLLIARVQLKTLTKTNREKPDTIAELASGERIGIEATDLVLEVHAAEYSALKGIESAAQALVAQDPGVVSRFKGKIVHIALPTAMEPVPRESRKKYIRWIHSLRQRVLDYVKTMDPRDPEFIAKLHGFHPAYDFHRDPSNAIAWGSYINIGILDDADRPGILTIGCAAGKSSWQALLDRAEQTIDEKRNKARSGYDTTMPLWLVLGFSPLVPIPESMMLALSERLRSHSVVPFERVYIWGQTQTLELPSGKVHEVASSFDD